MGNDVSTSNTEENESSTVHNFIRDTTDDDEQLVSDLNSLCENEIWDVVIEKAHLTKTIKEKTKTAENVPLHTAISHNAPIKVIQALVFAHPPMCAYQNKFGNTPLHFALWKNKGKDSLEIIS